MEQVQQRRYLRVQELTSAPARGRRPARQGRYPWCEATHWRKVKAGKYPQPVTLAGVTCWPLDVVEGWEQQQVAQGYTPTDTSEAVAASVQARRRRAAGVEA